jgi:hypothetical protein
MVRQMKEWFPIGLVLAVVAALAFGARTALAARVIADCDHCDATVNCTTCCNDQDFKYGACVAQGHPCLCWD